MKAEIITIGDELLIGQVIDTNSAWLGEQLSLTGIKVHQITSISDDREHILSTLEQASQRADIILITGGLGPTRDDVTKMVLCEFFNTSLVFNQEAFENIQRLFQSRGIPVTELNRRQAEVPAACVPLPNPEGTAPGMWFEKDGKFFISMPGVPFEMKTMFTQQVMPRLAKYTEASFIVHHTILTQGVGESFLAKTIEEWENNLPANVKLAYLPQPGIVRLRLTAVGDNKSALERQLETLEKELKPLISDVIFGYNTETMEEVVGNLLKLTTKSVATAESCTGGYIAHLITSVPGSSAYFKGSVIAYSNQVKTELLGVDAAILEKYGAVSEEVVRQMAQGVRSNLKTDYGIAVSGIAGPDGGSNDKPVGTTWIALACGDKTIAKKFLFGEHRGRNIRKAALAALNMLRIEFKASA
ncbi:MAG TPA: competence/damage-inducible protein A [Bacteroidales bacterium]|nr:competence/damage-inducible protein A [Bacteroidales bacterium]